MLGSCTLSLLVAVPVMSGEESNFVPFEIIKTYILTSEKTLELKSTLLSCIAVPCLPSMEDHTFFLAY